MSPEKWAEDAWHCDACGKFIYALRWKNGVAYPAPGAPAPMALGSDYPQVCSLCVELWLNLSHRAYWVALSAEWRKSNGRLKPGSDYFRYD